ncbi:MAG: DUF3302 domain-containing protein [Gammaproteobacteria bacterium]
MFLDYLALGFLIFGALVTFYLIIAIHDIPYEIAVKRNHPHQDAIHVAGWVSLLTLHTIWPFLWIWETIYRPDRGYGFSAAGGQTTAALNARIAELEAQLAALDSTKNPERIQTLESRLTDLEGKSLKQVKALDARMKALEDKPPAQEM